MRICILTSGYPIPTETFIFEPARWLRAAGHDVRVLTWHPGSIPAGPDGARPEIVPPLKVGLIRQLAAVARAPHEALLRAGEARRWRRCRTISLFETCARAVLPEVATADVLLAHFGRLGLKWLPVAAAARRPISVFFHGRDASEVLLRTPRIYNGLFASGAGMIANCEYMKARLVAAGAPAERVTVVLNGVNEEIAAAPGTPALESRRIVTIARLMPKKGLDDSIAAFARAQAALGGAWRYEVIGGGPLRDELERAARAAGVGGLVALRGMLPRAETLARLREAAIFVLASKVPPSGDAEGTPNSVIEAAVLGIPVVATRHAGIPELLPPEAGSEGFLVEEGDVAALAAAIGRLATDGALRRRWGERCAAFARPRHSPRAHVEALVAALGKARVPEPWA